MRTRGNTFVGGAGQDQFNRIRGKCGTEDFSVLDYRVNGRDQGRKGI